MAKLTLQDIDNLEATSLIAALNANFAAIAEALENTLSRDGTSPNTLLADVDANSQRIYNLPAASASTDAVRLSDLTAALTGAGAFQGNSGWSPIFSIESDSARRVLKIVDWEGGEGTKPDADVYVASDGFTTTIGDAVDIRGPAGAGTGDLLSTNNLSDVDDAPTALANLSGQTQADILDSIGGLSVVSGDILYGSGTDTASRLAKGTNGQVLQLTSGIPAWKFVGAPHFILEDQKTSGTSGGASSNSGAGYITRALNTEVYDPFSLVSISSNLFTLSAGTYYIEWWTIVANVDFAKSRLYNSSDASTVAFGNSGKTQEDNTNMALHGAGVVTISGSKNFAIQCQTGVAVSTGYGQATSFGTEVYTQVRGWRIG